MSDERKDIHVRIDPVMFEKLDIMADFEARDLSAWAARVLEKGIAGEWHAFDKLLRRYEALAQGRTENQRAGFVYIIRIGERYKIGKAVDWEKRVGSATMFPEAPEIVQVIEAEDRHALEQELHQKFADVRMHGEWFGLKPEHLEELRKFPDVKGSA